MYEKRYLNTLLIVFFKYSPTSKESENIYVVPMLLTLISTFLEYLFTWCQVSKQFFVFQLMDIKIQINVKNRQNSDIHAERKKIYTKISLEKASI